MHPQISHRPLETAQNRIRTPLCSDFFLIQGRMVALPLCGSQEHAKQKRLVFGAERTIREDSFFKTWVWGMQAGLERVKQGNLKGAISNSALH